MGKWGPPTVWLPRVSHKATSRPVSSRYLSTKCIKRNNPVAVCQSKSRMTWHGWNATRNDGVFSAASRRNRLWGVQYCCSIQCCLHLMKMKINEKTPWTMFWEWKAFPLQRSLFRNVGRSIHSMSTLWGRILKRYLTPCATNTPHNSLTPTHIRLVYCSVCSTGFIKHSLCSARSYKGWSLPFHSRDKHHHGGGIILYVQSDVRVLSSSFHPTLEFLSVNLQLKHGTFTTGHQFPFPIRPIALQELHPTTKWSWLVTLMSIVCLHTSTVLSLNLRLPLSTILPNL